MDLLEKAKQMTKAKPFIKWVGGKGQLIEQLDSLLPSDFDNWEDAIYIEPFAGGGAMLFYMLQRYSNISKAVINDINPDLTTCYRTVKTQPTKLIKSLSAIQSHYQNLSTEEERKVFYLQKRDEYNQKALQDIENTTLFFFLNRTCFNGLYRVNKQGQFNVPFGKYANPLICDPATIIRDSELLQKVEILTGDFSDTLPFANGKTLFYFDPPYRPISSTSSFNDYTKEAFNDNAQVRLKEFCDTVHAAGFKFMLSNSDGKSHDTHDTFFDLLYQEYIIERVSATRNVNANPLKRGKLTEILVHNYPYTKGKQDIFSQKFTNNSMDFSIKDVI